ncbi:SIMPL domain-containing protein [Oceanobacter kriegii]|uniref:SIMPL domain-containing protein n=1 Tax=Oceanobacter kriegii TaxID=64972 RepID=UPI000411339B|nr:SIMPL domain-containing protein [Oceanobacter kriegii]
MKFLTPVYALMLASSSLYISSSHADTSVTPSSAMVQAATVQVSASSEVKSMPDYVLVNLQLNDTQPTLEEAKTSVDKAFGQLLNITNELNIPQGMVRAEQIRNYPRYQWNRGDRRYTGEEVSRSVQISLYDLDQYTSLIDHLLQLPLAQIQNSSFLFEDPTKLENEALQSALLKARDKAELMAATMKRELGGVISMAENGNHAPSPMVFRSAFAKAESADTSSNMMVQEQSVSTSVTVQFELK